MAEDDIYSPPKSDVETHTEEIEQSKSTWVRVLEVIFGLILSIFFIVLLIAALEQAKHFLELDTTVLADYGLNSLAYLFGELIGFLIIFMFCWWGIHRSVRMLIGKGWRITTKNGTKKFLFSMWYPIGLIVFMVLGILIIVLYSG